MTTYKMAAIRTDNDTKYEMGNTNTKGKRITLDNMMIHGKEITTLFDGCGEWEFIWKNKRWEFYSEAGEFVGYIGFEIDKDAEYKKKMRLYEERKAVHAAYKKMIEEK